MFRRRQSILPTVCASGLALFVAIWATGVGATAGARDDAWDGRFSLPGTETGVIYAVAVEGDVVVVGGQFTSIGKAAANNIARWNGSAWESLGDGQENGVDGPVYSVAISGGAVYAGGQFSRAGSAVAGNVARWDGERWSSLGGGVSAEPGRGAAIVWAVSVAGTDAYVGGSFTAAAGVAAANIARWSEVDGAWSPLGSGLGAAVAVDVPFVRVIAASSDRVYVGGKFDTAGGRAARNVAVWSLADREWSGLGAGANGWVTALAADEQGVYAGGRFTRIGGAKAKYAARWDGRSWRRLGKGLAAASKRAQPAVNGMAVVGGDLYVTGGFVRAGTAQTNGLACWNGEAWEPVAGGLTRVGPNGTAAPSGGASLAGTATKVVVVGPFTHGGTSTAFGVAAYDVSSRSWRAVADPGPHFGIKAGPIATDGTDILVCAGNTYQVGETLRQGLLRWDGNAWHPAGPGSDQLVRGSVFAIATNGVDVYVGGSLGGVGEVATRNVLHWNGERWSALGNGVGGSSNSQVRAIAIDGPYVYVGGTFSDAGGVPANNVARWDGSRWEPVGAGLENGVTGDESIVEALAVDRSTLYVGGRFTRAGSVPANNVAQWDGASWTPLGDPGADGVDGSVFALAVGGDRLYVGGTFGTAGGRSARALAQWSAGAWQPVGDPLHFTNEDAPVVLALAFEGATLYVGGQFLAAGETPASHVAAWDGANWSSLGGGVNAFVGSIAVPDGSIYLGGGFSVAGGVPSVGIARFGAD